MAIERLLLLSGAMGAGKSSIAAVLKEKYFFSGISSSAYLRERQKMISLQDNRLSLQELGDRLDIETAFSWIINNVAIPTIESALDIENWLLDAVRKPRQVELFRIRFGTVVRHVHLSAPEAELERRFLEREKGESKSSYMLAIQHPNELSARSLGSVADQTFDTTRHSAMDIADQILCLWGVRYEE